MLARSNERLRCLQRRYTGAQRSYKNNDDADRDAIPGTRECKEDCMSKLSRRSMLRGSVGLAAAGTLARPFIANAAATTVSVWWPQGFVRQEDVGFRAVVAAYEQASGNKIDHTLVPFAPLMQKIVGALTIGDVPDVMNHDTAPNTVIPQNAWNDKLLDLSDVVETQKPQYHHKAILASQN